MKTKLFTLLVVLVASMGTVFAWDYERVQIGDLYYNLNEVTLSAEVTSQNSNYPYWSTTITTADIPASVVYNSKTYTVISIGNSAFEGCAELTSVTIGYNIRNIEGFAFWNSDNISSVVWNAKKCISCAFGNQVESFTFGENVEVIPSSLCKGMTQLTNISIPEKVTSIGDQAFDGCSNIISVVWNAKNCNSCAFGSQVESFVFGDEVEVIPRNLCSGMKKLTSVTIPNSVTSIGDKAFYNCTGLTSVTINSNAIVGKHYSSSSSLKDVFGSQVKMYVLGNSVTSIGNSAFSGCTELTSVTIGEGVTYIGFDAFNGCTSLTSPIYNSRIFFYLPTSFSGAYAIPEGIESVEYYAFEGCTGLTSITIPNSVTSIGWDAFSGCSSLTSITIPNSVTSIGDGAFEGCTELTSVVWNAKNCNSCAFGNQVESFTFGENVEVIPASLCEGMTKLSEIAIPNSITSIGNNAFNGCTGLKKVNISDIDAWCNINFSNSSSNPLNYANHLYLNDSEITDLRITNSVTSIGNYAFSGCNSLTSVEIPNSVTSIGNSAFYGCTGLTSIEIPNSVINIERLAFCACPGLTSVTFGNNLDYIGSESFKYCTGLKSIEIPNSVTSIGYQAFYCCYSLTTITMGNSVTSIGDKAFYDCNNLTSIYVPCGELERFQALLKNDKRVKYKPLPYNVQVKTAANGSVTYPKNSCDELVLNAIPDYGYHFVQWSDGNTDNPRAFELTQDTTFEASFAISNFTIDLQKNYDEMGEVTGGGSYEYLSKRTISATANYGYHFVQWKGVGQQIPQNTISASEAYAIASELSDQETTSTKYNIIGYVTGTYASYSNSYYLSDDPNVPGNFIAFKCTSSANIGDYVLVSGYLKNYRGNTPETASGATLTKVDSPYANPYSFTLTRDTTIIAEFAKNIYKLTVQSTDTSMGIVSYGGEFEYLTKYYLKATPNYGYHFVQWSDGNTDNPRYIQITQDTTFIAIFGKNPVIHYIYDYRKGSIEGDTTLASQASGDITFRAVPYPGYNFAQWADGNKDNPRTIFLDRDTTMEAIFEIALEGRCGKDLALTWTLDTTTLALSIEGEGELTENYTYGSYIRSVSIGKNVSDIGLEAFEHCFGITHVTLNSAAVVGKNYYYYYSSYTGYVYNTLTSIFGSGVEEYTFGGQIERIGSYAFYGSNKLTKVVIPEGCKYIGEYAFDNCGNIITIVCPSTVEYIGKSAFDSESIMNVYDYATTPQDMSVTNPYSGYALTLLRGVLATARLYVPEQSIELYREAYFWCYFGNILPIQATSVDVNDIRVTTTESTVTVLWPQINGAATYELVIRDKSGNSICTLVFNADGQLTQMVFNAPSRERAPQQTQTAGFSFTVTGLESNTGYNLTMTAKNSNGATLQTKTISFVTNGLQTLDNISDTPTKATKLLHTDQILILRGDKIYTITGQEVK